MASQSAGLRLALIVLILLVPAMIQAVLLGRTLEEDISAADRDRQGAAYVRLLLPLMTDALTERVSPETTKAFIAAGATLARKLGLEHSHANMVEKLGSGTLSHRAVLAQATEQARMAGEASGLFRDANVESQALGLLLASTLPELMKDFDRLAEVSSPITNMAVSDHERLAYLALVTGAWRENTDRLRENLDQAMRNSSSKETYSFLGEFSAAVTLTAGDLQRKLLNTRIGPGERRSAFRALFDRERAKYVTNLNALGLGVLDHMDAMLSQRHSVLGRQMAVLIGFSFFATIFSIGSAARMFQSTLRKLDEVEGARKEAEAVSKRLESINADIAQLNVELTEKVTRLKEAQDQLLKKGRMEQLGHLTATVAHELRNPLGAVRTSAFLLERKISGKGLGLDQQLLRINNGIQRCDDIITQLLDFSRSSAPTLQPADLDAWLRTIVEEEVQKLPSVVEVEFTPGLGELKVDFDGGRLSRAVINLLSNASEAMVGKGEDPKKFSVQDPRIVIETRRSERGVEIVVSDNGPGIADEHLSRILEPLFTTKSFGTGLGLPAVHRIMDQHGGGLEIASKLGAGASFTLWLPVESKNQQAA